MPEGVKLSRLFHVGRGFSESVLGVAGSVPARVEAGECYDYTHTFTLPDNILNVENCKLVIMAIEARSKNVLNGIELPLNGSYSGVGSIAQDADVSDSETPRYYDLNGMSVGRAQMRPGIYVELKGSKARKVIIK